MVLGSDAKPPKTSGLFRFAPTIPTTSWTAERAKAVPALTRPVDA